MIRKLLLFIAGNRVVLSILLASVLLAIYMAGFLGGRFSVTNQYEFKQDGALSLGESGIAFTKPFLTPELASQLNQDGFELEFRGRFTDVDSRRGSNILVIPDGDRNLDTFIVWQWRHHLIAMDSDDYDASRRQPRLSTTVAAGPQVLRLVSRDGRSTLYLNDEPVSHFNKGALQLPIVSGGTRLLLGNSAHLNNGWVGDIEYVALRHWLSDSSSQSGGRWQTVLELPFVNEGEHLLSGADVPGGLTVPDKIGLMEQDLLSMPSRFERWKFWSLVDYVVNVAGFIPLGVLFLLVFWRQRPAYVLPLAIGGSFLVSFSIEYIQSWMYFRHSSVLDLILNTTGGAVGTLCAAWWLRSPRKIGA